MLPASFQPLEKAFFRTLNRYVEPLIRTGTGSPGLIPVGAVVLETTGRKSGRTYEVPVLASEFADLLLVSTVRSGSNWVKNLAANPEIKVWLRGQSIPATAYVINPQKTDGQPASTASPFVQFLIDRLRPLSKVTGASFAILDWHNRPSWENGRILDGA